MTTKSTVVYWCLLLSMTLATCSKEKVPVPYSYVNLRVQGQEEDIGWQETTGTWTSSSGTLEMDCMGIYFDRFRLRLKEIINTGDVANLTVDNIYYTNGLDFTPKGIQFGYVKIMEVNRSCIKGIYQVYFENNSHSLTSKMITGDFGIVLN